MQVGLFITCLTDTFFPRVAAAVVAVLRHQGCEVRVPLEQTCCGQPAYNSGLAKPAAQLVDRLCRIFEADEYVVSPSASCVTMAAKHGPELFAEGSAQRRRAEAFARKTYEFTSFLVEVLGVDLGELVKHEDTGSPGAPGPVAPGVDDTGSSHASGTVAHGQALPKTTYHYPCHCRGLVSCQTGRDRAERLAGNAFVELPRADQCCGFGGTFSTDYAPISNTMLADKIDTITDSGAALLVCDEAGCRLNIAGGLHRRGSSVRVAHTAELIAESLGLALPDPEH